MSPGPKNGLESCVSRFSTICAKNQVLKLKIDKVTVIRVYGSCMASEVWVIMHQIPRGRLAPAQLFENGFRHNFSKNCPQDLKIG